MRNQVVPNASGSGVQVLVAGVHRGQPLLKQLAVEQHRRAELGGDQGQRVGLQRPFIGEVVDLDRLLLPDPPAAPAGLAHHVHAVLYLVKGVGMPVEQIESGLDELGMAEQHLRTVFHLLGQPLFTPFRADGGGLEDGHPQPLGFQDGPQAWCEIAPVGVGQVDDQPPAARPLAFGEVEERPLFRVEHVVGQRWR